MELEISKEDIESIKDYLKRRGKGMAWVGYSLKRRRFIEYCTNYFFLGGDTLYRKTGHGSEKVIGPIRFGRFMEEWPKRMVYKKHERKTRT
ncbi:hypothetical protein NEPAR06_1852 [Nematocida parisii]|uniref:uncharacterized protein n=1 Tax=Nematocida parisii (strain ERTm1 / ATCC PRA-289) TaxID=881290 RepID=UPI000264BADB|nr:uncharacterized protein NEPG_00211 [Nematocida parisii ERTm1]EIJ94688.1 hypothetical protein NEPG_00211 [Nematocida parisii ERTm1]KAI5155466.1 hypothetical protein NEPAR06_1852 [Nematocida parisii]KAI5158136.1 hypothetical protein NEPAR05_1899 [Nematocida parisii]|eukprot:XP_013058044.1 hypothetical protein NEPG_00211 [Nematocida parisii ERTm1]